MEDKKKELVQLMMTKLEESNHHFEIKINLSPIDQINKDTHIDNQIIETKRKRVTCAVHEVGNWEWWDKQQSSFSNIIKLSLI